MFWKTSLRKWHSQLWVLIFAIGIPCLGQNVSPLGATTHQEGGTTFRFWVPFVDSVAVRINDSQPVSMTRDNGHPQADDTFWEVNVPGAKAGDRYKYLIKSNGVTREFIDPRARQLTGAEVGASSVIVEPTNVPSQQNEPSVAELVIYELHIGTFNVPAGSGTGTFATAIDKLDFLKDLGVNAVEVMPVHQNPSFSSHTPANFNWGYDPVQLYAVNSSYGTPQDFERFVKACHDRKIAVLLDVVYNHLVPGNLLMGFGGVSGPGFKDGVFFYGDNREDTGFGPRPDFAPSITATLQLEKARSCCNRRMTTTATRNRGNRGRSRSLRICKARLTSLLPRRGAASASTATFVISNLQHRF